MGLRAHALQRAGDIGLRVDQEQAAGDDFFALLQPAANGRDAGGFMEYLHDFRHEAALIIHGNHSLLAAAVDQRFGGDQQHRFAFAGQLQIGVHPPASALHPGC